MCELVEGIVTIPHSWKEQLDHVIKAHAEADRQTVEAPDLGDEPDSALSETQTS